VWGPLRVKAKDFWLYQWIDNYLVNSPERASQLLNQRAPLNDLRQMAAEVEPALSTVSHDDGPAIVAGCGLAAIQERIRVAQTNDPSVIAHEIRTDLILLIPRSMISSDGFRLLEMSSSGRHRLASGWAPS
jgi:hypothetical protein